VTFELGNISFASQIEITQKLTRNSWNIDYRLKKKMMKLIKIN